MKLCLVVDDSSVIRKVARALLQRLDYEVIEADNGKDAIARCAETMPHAILIDWDLPDMSGFDFLVEFKQKYPASKPHIVYATTENDALDISRALKTGASDYLMVPFERADIEQKFQHSAAAA